MILVTITLYNKLCKFSIYLGELVEKNSVLKKNGDYEKKCSIQKSSLATDDAIWIGINDADPQILAGKTKQGGTGWVKYDIPGDVTFITRMHLNRALAKKILPILERFIETGEIV